MKTRVRLLPVRTAALALLAMVIQGRSADYPTTVQSFSPLAYWRFNETAVAPAQNSVANSGSLGAIGNGYAVSDVLKGEVGKFGNCIRLQNPALAAGYCASKVDVPFNAALNPNPPFSVEFWAKPNALGADGTGFCPLSSFNPNWYGGGNRSGFLFYLNNAGRWEFRLGTIGGYTAVLDSPNGAAVAGTWNHIVATYDGATASLYVDGVFQNSIAAPLSNWTRNTQMALRFGGTSLTGTASDGPAISASGISGNRGFDGWLDEVAIYPSVLSASTVAAHFAAATTNNAGYSAQVLASTPVGYWSLNESAVTAPDPSTFPILANSGSLGSDADGTNMWGALTAQPGSGYAGMGAGNSAIKLDGENGYVALKDAAGLHFTNNITVMAWVKPGVQDFFRDIISHGWDSGYAETFLRISRGGNNADGFFGENEQTFYELGSTDGSTYDAAYYSMPPGDIGNWVHLAGTYDGANWNLYRNGSLVASVASANGVIDVANRWSIGSRSGPSPTSATGWTPDRAFAVEGLFFGGSIDEPAIFGTALSASDINTIYNSAQVSPVITRAITNPGSVFKGASASFSVWAEGSPALSYSWTSNGVALASTATNITLNNFAGGSQTIAVVVTNPYGSATSSVTFAAVAAAPFFAQQPVAAKRYTGFPFSFSVVANGSTPISYQWKTNGVDITGATSPTYTAVASPSVAFNYSCTLSNEAGMSNSVAVPLTVLSIPAGYATAVVSGSPTPPIAYWRLGETSGSTANEYIGGHNGTYFAAALGQPGYSIVDPDTAVAFAGANSYVGNISGTEINFSGHTNFSLEAWVNAPAGLPDESTIIAKGAGSSGTTATEQFSLDVVGGKYRFFTRGNNNAFFEADASVGPDGTWQHIVGVYDDTDTTMYIYVNGALSGSGGTRPSGLRVSSALVSIGSKHLGNSPTYDGVFPGTIDEVAVYNYALSAATAQAHYSAAYGPSLAPAISKQPSAITNYISLPASLSVGAYGTVPLNYQWKKNGIDISGANSNVFTISSLSLSDDDNYSVTISNVNGATNSVSVHLTVLPAPTSAPSVPGLVLHLPFDNNLTDATGRGNNGVGIHRTATTSNTAAATFASDGKIGQALHYQSDMGSYPGPTQTNNDYVTLGVRPDLQFGATVNFSVAYWIRLPANYIGGDLPFLTDTPGSTFGSGFVFAPTYGDGATAANTGTTPGGWAMSLFDTAGNGLGVYGDIGTINDGNWHHLLHVITRTSGMVTYLDGIVANFSKQAGTSISAAGNIDSSPANAVTIGQDPTGTYGETGSADIDDLGIWRKALSPLEAASVYMAGVNGLSYTGGSIGSLSVQRIVGNKLVLSWSIGTLQSADSVEGPYTDVNSATSPLTVTPSAAKKFYRTRL